MVVITLVNKKYLHQDLKLLPKQVNFNLLHSECILSSLYNNFFIKHDFPDTKT
jgi:hypothetical protein